ncbi:late endosome to vacuole transport-related protein [Cantharellus anzutake]|uniref:late endosome to vacuole transport-related protein n=1 Tax=Cantharellus anzutake TaxID=1750568 RepID=UPI0019078196|nr:late endosome to vacuole transport-related protein [Cantharellus anzutake]KAF8336837.1 late endosome to vacuole transport-related protein [Cantharellus anzutake]
MSGWMSWFTGPKDTKRPAREAIIKLRQNLQLLERKEEHLQKQIDEQHAKAKANAVTNQNLAKEALKRKKVLQADLDRLSGQKFTLESQVNALESANINQEVLDAMTSGANALSKIHGKMTVEQVETTMDSIREQMAVTQEISNAISTPMVAGIEIDDFELDKELEELEQEELNTRLKGAERVPIQPPVSPTRETADKGKRRTEESEEERELRELQASLAM